MLELILEYGLEDINNTATNSAIEMTLILYKFTLL